MPQLYVEYQGDKPVAFRYGEPWVATQLFIEGGYPSEEEAIAAWEREQKKELIRCAECRFWDNRKYSDPSIGECHHGMCTDAWGWCYKADRRKDNV